MATVTTNFGFDIPQSSDLVKNGATQIALLGQDIDTFLAGGVGFSAGKNKIINGDFYVNQRAFTTTTSSGSYGLDRWQYVYSGGTVTYSAETFTLGTAPVAGYEGKTFARVLTASQSTSAQFAIFRQQIESVRTFAGQTITVSFWAKAASGTPKVALELAQGFGTGGSPSAEVTTYSGQVTLSTSWARYSITVAVPSISGKTIGTNNDDRLIVHLFTSAGSNFDARTGSIGIQNNTIDFWGVQAEKGSVATPFQTATGTIQGELAACQRYYQKTYVQTTAPATTTAIGSMNGVNSGTTLIIGLGRLPVVMRTAPTITLYSSATGATGQVRSGGADVAATAADVGDNGIGYLSATGLTAGGNSTIHYAASAEL